MNIIDQESLAWINDIHLNSLPSVNVLCKNELPEYSGVYLVINHTKDVLYVGQSLNLKTRWKSHKCTNFLNDKCRILWIKVSPDLLGRIENFLIDKFSPVLNKRFLNNSLSDTEDRFYRVRELLDRYGLSSRQSLDDRINYLKIKPSKEAGKKGFFINSSYKTTG